ncbi:MAG: hypothetical protein V8R46_01165 [Eubacterium ramulus]
MIQTKRDRGVTGEKSFSTIYVWTLWYGPAQSFFINGGIDCSGRFHICPQIPIVYIVALALLFWCIFSDVFPEYVSKRSVENQKYLNFKYRVVCKVKKGKYGRSAGSASFAQKRAQMKYRQEQKKIYRFFACPNCAQKVRVPKGKGRICITCPKCKTEFIKRS